FILASASPRRLTLLAQAGYTPDKTIPADIDEAPLKNELPLAYVARIAAAKAEHVARQHPDTVVLAADTIVTCGRRILHKTDDAAIARAHLKLLSGRRHRVTTAICIRHKDKTVSRQVTTQVKFKRLHAQ